MARTESCPPAQGILIDPPSPRTGYVARLLAARPLGPDDYTEDLLQIERTIAAGGASGVASWMSFLNLISRYPREYESIRRELGVDPEDWTRSKDRIEGLVEERLRLAERRAGAPGSFL